MIMRRRLGALSGREQRDLELFFNEMMEAAEVGPPSQSLVRLEEERFLAEWLGEPAYPLRGLARSSPAMLRREPGPVGPSRMVESDSAETAGAKSLCPEWDEVVTTWRTLAELRKLLAASKEEIESNPLVIEVEMMKALADVLDTARQVPVSIWREIWDELGAFASCDVKPIVARVKAGEKHANAVLRVLHGFTSILQGYVHDRIDDAFKSQLNAQKGWGKAAAKLLIHVIKKQVPVIQREIQAKNFAAVASAFEDLKKQLSGQGFSVTGVLGVVVELGIEIIGNAIDDALNTSVRWAAKQVGKRLLGSAAGAASALFILEDIVHFVHALVTISNHNDRQREFNRVLLGFLARVRPCKKMRVRPGETPAATIGWKNQPIVRVDWQVVLYSFVPEAGGPSGKGEWRSAPLEVTFDGKKKTTVRVDLPAPEWSGRYVMSFRVPPVAQWPGAGGSYVALDATLYRSGGQSVEKSIFVAACKP